MFRIFLTFVFILSLSLLPGSQAGATCGKCGVGEGGERSREAEEAFGILFSTMMALKAAQEADKEGALDKLAEELARAFEQVDPTRLVSQEPPEQPQQPQQPPPGPSQGFQELKAEIRQWVQDLLNVGIIRAFTPEFLERLYSIRGHAEEKYYRGEISDEERTAIKEEIDRMIAEIYDSETYRRMILPPPPPSEPEPPGYADKYILEELSLPQRPEQPEEGPSVPPEPSPTTEAVLKATQKKEGVTTARTRKRDRLLYERAQKGWPFYGNDEWGRPQVYIDKDGDGFGDTVITYGYDGRPSAEAQWGEPGTGQFRVRIYNPQGGYTEYVDTDNDGIMDKKITADHEGHLTEESVRVDVEYDPDYGDYTIWSGYDNGTPHVQEAYDKDGNLRQRITRDADGNITIQTWDANGNPVEGYWLPSVDWAERAREEFTRGTGIVGHPSPYGGGGADYEWVIGEDGIPRPTGLAGRKYPPSIPKLPPLSLEEGLESNKLALSIRGTGTTTGMTLTLTNKTDSKCMVVIPTGTLLEPENQAYSPYQVGYVPPVLLWPGRTATVKVPAFCADSEKRLAPPDGSVAYTPHKGPLTPRQEKLTELIVVTKAFKGLHETCGDAVEPDDLLAPYNKTPQKPFSWFFSEFFSDMEDIPEEDLWVVKLMERFLEMPEGSRFWSYILDVPLDFKLSSPLEFPGNAQFQLGMIYELETGISSRKEKGKAVFSNPTGKVAVSLAPTGNPNIVKFNITALEAHAPSFKAMGKSRGDINLTLNSPENSAGTLNIKTGEVKGTVSVKAWGKKYDAPFPAAASYRGRFDIPTRKLSLNVKGISFEPAKLERGIYERIRPEKFWDSVQLYSIWKDTNDLGEEELTAVMTEQLRADFSKERAEGLAAMVAKEIFHRVDDVHERHKKLKKEKMDFSMLDPTLRWRKK
ncbi:MAG: hypothetical protein Q6354_08065 [Candidatus Brocadiales bacterium]|nr:hypothetical protein [Candidatus Brocadiales bacterium]